MKIIFSRKGFDSTKRYGGKPSPIIDGSTLLSIPIPEDKKLTIRYRELADSTGYFDDLGRIAEQLTGLAGHGEKHAHLDPDLRWASYRREHGWRPIFGQVDQSQTHLSNQGVGRGDLFLFYGLYRGATVCSGRITYVRGAPLKHVLWGWLTVGDILKVRRETDAPNWARYHAHATDKRAANNIIYVAATSAFTSLPGAGIFPTYSDDLSLTDLQATNIKPSVWRLPRWCAPRNERFALTYHGKPKAWTTKPDCVLLQTKSPGQEFVLDTVHYPEAIDWARNLIARHGQGWEIAKPRATSAGEGH